MEIPHDIDPRAELFLKISALYATALLVKDQDDETADKVVSLIRPFMKILESRFCTQQGFPENYVYDAESLLDEAEKLLYPRPTDKCEILTEGNC